MIFIAFHQFDRHNTIEKRRKKNSNNNISTSLSNSKKRRRNVNVAQTVFIKDQYIFTPHKC